MNLFNLILLANNPNEPAFMGLTAGEVATYGIVVALVLLGIGLFIAIVGPFLYSLLNLKQGWKGWAAGIGFVLLCFLAYTVGSGNDTLVNYATNRGVTPGQFNFVNGISILFFILFFIATALFVLSLLKDIIQGFLK